MSEIEDLLNKIEKKFNCQGKTSKFPDYISSIHFPCFKGLEPNSYINFNFPLTVLIGENGCGKSSVLQALETTPEGVSYTAKWFSTNVDPIPENPRPAFWYTYFNSEAKREVQILNQRTKKKDNPDYWEPSRPVVKYGMDKFEEHNPPLPGASQTRWNGTKRDVLYVDFRAEITAFDRYFYYEENPNTIKWKTKQDFLRYKSKYLKSVLNGEITTSYTFRNKKPVQSIESLNECEVKIISEILDKKYTSIKIITHSFYKHNGDSVFFSQKQTDGIDFLENYSDAVAGSGESAIVKLVHQIKNCTPGTLILLDEPEVSLHPGAQKRLLKFLLNSVLENGNQVIISSHSPSIVEELPSEALVLLKKTSKETFIPKNNISADIAFTYIGHLTSKKTILVEDKAAQLLIKTCLNFLDEKAKDSINVEYHNGGAEDLYKESVIYSRNNQTDYLIILDGDKNHNIAIPSIISPDKVDSIISNFTGISPKSLPFSADGGKQKEQLLEEKKKFISFLNSSVKFFPTFDPEQIMWDASSIKDPDIIDDDYKTRIMKFTEKQVGSSTSEEIFHEEKRFCHTLDENNQYIQILLKYLKDFFEKN